MAGSDSGEEFEPFQMMEEEFLPKKRKMTKEDHIYGLWAEHDSDEDERYWMVGGDLHQQSSENQWEYTSSLLIDTLVCVVQDTPQHCVVHLILYLNTKLCVFRRKDYTRPMTFVSSKQDGQDDDGDSESDKEVNWMSSSRPLFHLALFHLARA